MDPGVKGLVLDGIRERILNYLRRLFWVRSYEVSLVPAGANGVEDFLDGVKSLSPAGTLVEGEQWISLGESLAMLGAGLKSIGAGAGDASGMQQAMADALDAVVEHLTALSGTKGAVDSHLDPLAADAEKALQAVHALRIEGLMLQGSDPLAAKAILGLCDSVAAVFPPEAVAAVALMDPGEKGKPAAGKPGGHKTPPKGYPTDPDLYLDPANFKYPVNNEERTRAAITYLSREKPGGPGGYTRDELVWMWNKLRKYAAKYDIELSPKTGLKGVLMGTSTGSIKITVDAPLSGEVHMDGQKVADLKDATEHVLTDVVDGEHDLKVVTGGKVLHESKAVVAAGKETVVGWHAVKAGSDQPPIVSDSLVPQPPAVGAGALSGLTAPVVVPPPKPADASSIPDTGILLKALADMGTKLDALAKVPEQISAFSERLAAAEKKVEDFAEKVTVGAKAQESVLALLSTVPAGAPAIAAAPTGGGSPAPSEGVNEDDLGKSPRLKAMRENMKKGGGFPPVL